MPGRTQDVMMDSRTGHEGIAAALTAPLLRNNNVTNAEEAVELYRKVLAALQAPQEEAVGPGLGAQVGELRASIATLTECVEVVEKRTRHLTQEPPEA